MATGLARFHHGTGVPPSNHLSVLRFMNILAYFVDVVVILLYSHQVSKLNHHNVTPFSSNQVMNVVYWIVLLLWQILFLVSLFTSDQDLLATATRGVHTHFFLFHVFMIATVLLFISSHFILAEIAVCLNFLNTVYLYLRLPRPTAKAFISIHVPVLQLPFAVLVLYVLHYGAVMVHCHDFGCRILANVVVWEILVLGGVLLLVFKDWALGLALAYQAASLGVGQLFTKVIALQWIFAFVIAGCLASLSLVVMVTPTRTVVEEQGIVPEGDERAPLLQ